MKNIKPLKIMFICGESFFNGQSNALFMKMKNETNIVKGDLQTTTEILKRSIKFGEIIQFMDFFAKRP